MSEKPETKKAAAEREQREARDKLRAMLPPGTTVSLVLRHCSRSGMLRVISPLVSDNGAPSDISWLVNRAGIGSGFDRKRGGIKMGGCGMDMGFALVYNMGRALYPDGFKLGPGQYGRNGDKSGFDKDGGYALKHNWL